MIRCPLPDGLTAARVGPTCAVTGAAGYLGSALVPALRDLGCTVRAIDLLPAFADDPDIETVCADVRDVDALTRAFHGVDTVFHGAAVISILKLARRAERERVWSINVGGTMAVIAACRAAGVRRLVSTSTINVCMDGPRHEQDECAPYASPPSDLYSETKIAAERAVLAAHGPELATCALRPGGLWGPGTGGFMLREFLAQLASDRFVATFGDPSAVVDNTHVFNLVIAELLAAARLAEEPARVGGRAYHVTDDERINGLAWFRPVVEAMGHRWPRARVPSGVLRVVGWTGELAHYLGGPRPTLTASGVLKLTASTSFRVDKARADLGWSPIRGHVDGMAEAMPDLEGIYRGLRAAR